MAELEYTRHRFVKEHELLKIVFTHVCRFGDEVGSGREEKDTWVMLEKDLVFLT